MSDGILLGPGPLAKAVAKPYSATYLWQNGDYCAHDGKIYKFIGESLLVGEQWTPAHWAETKLTDEIIGLAQQIDALDPEAATGLFTDISFTINSNQWTSSNNVWSYNLSNNLIKSTSGIEVFYDDSFRTALSGDVKVNKNTGYVTFITTGEPQGALTGTLRIIDSVSGVLPVSRGGTGASTAKEGRRNLNASIRPIPVSFTSVTSLPQTVYDDDITADMVTTDWVFSNPSSVPNGILATTAAGSVTISLPTGGSISGETDITFSLVNPRTFADNASGQQSEQYVGEFVQIGAQSLTLAQQAQVRTNVGAASASDVSSMSIQSTTLTSVSTSANGNITTSISSITEVVIGATASDANLIFEPYRSANNTWGFHVSYSASNTFYLWASKDISSVTVYYLHLPQSN